MGELGLGESRFQGEEGLFRGLQQLSEGGFVCPFGKSAEGPQLPSTASGSEIPAAPVELKTATSERAAGAGVTWFAASYAE